MMEETIDPKVKAFVTALGRTETGGHADPYNARGASGEFGRYQFMPDTYTEWATQYGVDPNDKSIGAQNKIAYNKVKELKEKGLNPAQIASIWNSGDENAYKGTFKTGAPAKGVNSKGVAYDVPNYVSKFSQIFNDINKGGIQPGTTQTTPIDQTNEPTVQPKTSLGKKILGVISTFGGGTGWSEDLIGAIDAGKAEKMFEQVSKDSIAIAYSLAQRIQEKSERGEDTSALKKALAQHIASTPKLSNFLPDVANKTEAQILGDFAQLGLTVGSTMIPGASATTLGRVGAGSALGAAYGTASAMSEGKTSAGDILKETAIGGVVGGGLVGLVEGMGAVWKGGKTIISRITGRTADEILKVPASEVSKLTDNERQFWMAAKKEAMNKELKDSERAIQQEVQNKQNAIIEENKKLAVDIGKTSRENLITVKPKVQEALKNAGEHYEELIQNGIEKIGDPKINTNELADHFAADFENRPEIYDDAIKLLGIKEDKPLIENGLDVIEAGVGGEDINVSELYKRVKQLKMKISSTAKRGTRVYTPQEYKLDKILESTSKFLKSKGFDMTEANQFWAKYAPVRNRIVNEVKPFDLEGTKKMPFAKTMERAITKEDADAQNIVKEFDKLLSGEYGTQAGKTGQNVEFSPEVKASLKKLGVNKEKLAEMKSKIETLRLQSEKEARVAAAKEGFNRQKYEIDRKVAMRKKVQKILGAVVGVTALSSGLGKLILHYLAGV